MLVLEESLWTNLSFFFKQTYNSIACQIYRTTTTKTPYLPLFVLVHLLCFSFCFFLEIVFHSAALMGLEYLCCLGNSRWGFSFPAFIPMFGIGLSFPTSLLGFKLFKVKFQKFSSSFVCILKKKASFVANLCNYFVKHT